MISETVDTTLNGLLQGIIDDPVEDRYSVLADYLEEYDDPRRAELLRLHRKMLNTCCEDMHHTERTLWHSRIVELIGMGVVPCVPQQIVIVHGVEMVFNFISPGAFLMGSPPSEEGRYEQEGPQHRVTLTRGFYLGVSAVTHVQWEEVMGNNPSNFKGENRPVESVSWDDIQGFCRKMEKRVEKQFRLPTEAEWEYACRAGTTTPFHFGEATSTDQINYNGSYAYSKGQKVVYRQQTTPGGSFPPNAWGLYDMHGNILEWCQDYYSRYYQGHTKDLEDNDVENMCRVFRGGCWSYLPRSCRSASRFRLAPSVRSSILGFRVVMDI